MPVVKHIVMFRLKPEATEADHQAIVDGLLALVDQSGVTMQSHEVGVDLRLPAGQAHPLGPNRQISWTCSFATVDDYNTYNTSAAHVAFLAALKPLVEPGSRAAIQYEVVNNKE